MLGAMLNGIFDVRDAACPAIIAAIRAADQAARAGSSDSRQQPPQGRLRAGHDGQTGGPLQRLDNLKRAEVGAAQQDCVTFRPHHTERKRQRLLGRALRMLLGAKATRACSDWFSPAMISSSRMSSGPVARARANSSIL